MVGFSELPSFSKRVVLLLDDDSYAALQIELSERPDAGKLIVHGSGMRKIRWAAKGRGKSGGVRVIYYWQTAEGSILMLDIYSKNEKENLTAKEVEALRRQLPI
jgi:mRNA-degrading endonuclease RelE of RelBE toxin-antitoxin system